MTKATSKLGSHTRGRALAAALLAAAVLLVLPQHSLARAHAPAHTRKAARSADNWDLHTMLSCVHPTQLRRTGACRTRVGTVRLHLKSSGETLYSHGGDPIIHHPAPPAIGLFEAKQVFTPDASDLNCVTYSSGGGRYFELLYVYPTTGSIRPAARDAVVPQFETASAFVNDQANAEAAGASAMLNVACDSGVPHLDVASVAAPPSTMTDPIDIYGLVTSELAAQGYNKPNVHYAFYWDDPDGGDVAGMGDLYPDSSPGASNENMSITSSRYAMTWNTSYPSASSDTPWWEYLLHESSHTMGAVQNATTAHPSSDTTSGGHCFDQPDIMCYNDGGIPVGKHLNTTKCDSSEASPDDLLDDLSRYDCNGDAYFNPTPVAGSWLSNHWNLASPNNLYMDLSVPPDTTAPSVPSGVTGSSGSDGKVHVSWAASIDDRGVTSYTVYRSDGGTFSEVGTSGSATYLDSSPLGIGATAQYEVTASDAAGNTSGMSAAGTVVGRDAQAPSVPTSVGVTGSTPTSITIGWNPSTDNVGVVSYTVSLSTNGVVFAPGATSPTTGATISGLAPLTTYEVRVTASDAAGNVSVPGPSGYPGYIVAATTGSTTGTAGATPNPGTTTTKPSTGGGTAGGFQTAPGSRPSAAPPRPRVRALPGHRSVRVLWPKVKGATTYVVMRGTGSGPVKRIATTHSPSYLDRSAKHGVRYRYVVIAVSAKGATSAPSASKTAAPGK